MQLAPIPFATTPPVDSVRRFCAESVREREGVVLPQLSAYASYHEWAVQQSLPTVSLPEFDAELRRVFPHTRLVTLGPASVYTDVSISADAGTPVALPPANTWPL